MRSPCRSPTSSCSPRSTRRLTATLTSRAGTAHTTPKRRATTGRATVSSPTTEPEEIDMSEGFHVHGPHDHELEHAAQHEPKGMAGQLAVITAILATVGAIFAYMGGATQAN